LIPKFISAFKKGKRLAIYGNGKQSRDFTLFANVVEANLFACEAEGVNGEVFNVACREIYSLIYLVYNLNEILKSDINPVSQNLKEGDVKHSLTSIRKAKKMLQFNLLVSFIEGLKKMCSKDTIRSIR